jgi:adenylate kinase family enzyme
MSHTLIAFAGPAGAGKSYASRLLADRYGYLKLSFADPLRQMLSCLTDVEDRYNERKHELRPELCNKSVRFALQTLGTEWGREHMGFNIWVEQMRYRVNRYRSLQSQTLITIDDLRFDNEAELVQSLGGMVVLIDRSVPSIGTHVSEKGIRSDLVNLVIDNDGDLASFIHSINHLANHAPLHS